MLRLIARIVTLVVLGCVVRFYSAGAVTISTAQYNGTRNNANLNETVLNTSNVNVNSFGRLGGYLVDGEVHARPLYIPGVTMNGVVRNVLYIATMNNSIYAFNADQVGSAPLWMTHFAPAVPPLYAGICPAWATGSQDGMLSTPVIDTTTNTLYAVYATAATSNTYTHYIAAVDIRTGQNRAGSPAHIVATAPGTGYDNVAGVISLNGITQIQRTALTLANGSVYVGFGSCGPDPDPFHGWLLGYSAANVSVQTSVFLTTPNGNEGAIWQGGGGLAFDAQGHFYVATANGSNSTTDLSDSVVQFGSSGQPLANWTDPNYVALAANDLDLGSSAPVYIQSLNLLLTGGKAGAMHVLNPAFFGTSTSPLLQTWQATGNCSVPSQSGCSHIFSLSYWDNATNPLLYIWGTKDVLKAYRYSSGAFNTTPDSTGTMAVQNLGGMMTLSANGGIAASGVLWVITSDGILHAYQATNVATELYNSTQNATRDTVGDSVFMNEPVVVNGKVYVPTKDGVLQVYGLLGSGTQGTVTASATFVGTDAATQGNWPNAYGADGYNVLGDLAQNPSYANPVPSGQSSFTWAFSSTDVRALQKPSNLNDRVASSWFSTTTFYVDSNITDSATHKVALYCLDWTNSAVKQIVDVIDTNGNIVDTETISAFNNGVYMVWNVSGHVKFRITLTSGPNAEISGIFFGGPKGTQPPPNATATFVRSDTTTQGNWATNYGGDGYSVAGDQTLNPGYASPAITPLTTTTWVASTTDVRALVKPSNSNDRIAAAWSSATSFTIDSNITDTVQHTVALYLLDWLRAGIVERVDVVDPNGNVLNTQTPASFGNGTYLVWTVTGHVLFRITVTTGNTALISGIFFGGPRGTQPPPNASATFLKLDSTTQGGWRAAYGGDGYTVVGDTASNPSYANLVATGQSSFTWVTSTGDVRALQKASNPTDRVAAAWYAPAPFLIDSNITDTAQHTVAIYCLDWDSTTRRQTIDVLDTNGNVLNTQALTTSYNGGVYLVWNVTGHVIFRVTWTGGLNGVVSGVFFGGPVGTQPPPTATATFVKLDSMTHGSWRSVYGGDGYNVVGDTALNASYANVVATGQNSFVWAASTSDTDAPQKASNPNDRIAAAWYLPGTFFIDTNITDSAQHTVALYCLDWDSTARRQTIDVMDMNGNVLNTQSLTTSFDGGVYLVWNVTGHVKFRVTWTGGLNAVVSGVFFGPPSGTQPPPAATATFVGLDSITLGSWRNAYGGDGYNVVGDTASNPSYANPIATGQNSFTWVASTSDVRATQKGSNPNDRIAAAWYAPAPFLIDSNITDSAQHTVAIYCLDWDSTARRQSIDVLDTNGNVLNTQALTTSYNGGVYLVWNVTGHVIFRVNWTGGLNGVVSGIFFGPASGTQPPPTGSATFVKTDTTTQGSWQNVYGQGGYVVVGDTTLNPTYATPSAGGQSSWTWAASTSDVRALQKGSNPNDRIAAAWYAPAPFIIDTNITDSAQHTIAIYCLDWDSTARRQSIDVLDANGNVLNTQALTTSYNGGVYLVWTVTGHVKFRVNWTGGLNGLVNGVFFSQ
jgi:hypothetical protein